MQSSKVSHLLSTRQSTTFSSDSLEVASPVSRTLDRKPSRFSRYALASAGFASIIPLKSVPVTLVCTQKRVKASTQSRIHEWVQHRATRSHSVEKLEAHKIVSESVLLTRCMCTTGCSLE